jgi:hypothetical protein
VSGAGIKDQMTEQKVLLELLSTRARGALCLELGKRLHARTKDSPNTPVTQKITRAGEHSSSTSDRDWGIGSGTQQVPKSVDAQVPCTEGVEVVFARYLCIWSTYSIISVAPLPYTAQTPCEVRYRMV